MTKDIHLIEPRQGSNEPQNDQVNSMRIYYPNTPQMMKIRDLVATLEDTGHLADCVNEMVR